MSSEQRFWLITTNELNRLVYNGTQTERYGISKVVKRETLCGMRNYKKTYEQQAGDP